MVEKIKIIRQEIEYLLTGLPAITMGREVSLAKTQYQRGRMWLGQLLKLSGNPNPYPESMNPESPVIEPQADMTEKSLLANDDFAKMDNIARVKWLRMRTDVLLKDLDEALKECPVAGLQIAFVAHCAILEAKMWLGEELGRMRNETQKSGS